MKNSFSKSSLLNTRGQIVVEYVLLLVVGVAVASLITTQMVSRDTTNPGFLIHAWSGIINFIGSDTADDLATPAN